MIFILCSLRISHQGEAMIFHIVNCVYSSAFILIVDSCSVSGDCRTIEQQTFDRITCAFLYHVLCECPNGLHFEV